MATGAAAMMAIRVLLDHDVPEQNILLVSLLMAASGVSLYCALYRLRLCDGVGHVSFIMCRCPFDCLHIPSSEDCIFGCRS